MKQYLNLLEDILKNGDIRDDRTGVGTIGVFGRQLCFDLKMGFPAMTTKKLAWKACKGELLWFIKGSSNERMLAEITHGDAEGKTTIWTPNANAPYWKPKAKYEGDLGRVYGVQWRDFGGVDQLANVIAGIKNDPYGRRHIVSAWNVPELDQMALPPCHILFQFYVSSKGELSCHMYQRSVDVFLGLPFNIASYALLTHMVAQVCGLTVGEFILSTGDTHIYKDHVEQVREQLSRTPYELSTLILNPEIKDIEDFKMEDIVLNNYTSYAPIKANMAV